MMNENCETGYCEYTPTVSYLYGTLDPFYHISALDTSYLGEKTKAVWIKLTENFDMYYETYEIGGDGMDDFKNMMQSCLNRNADTFERQLEVYDDDIAKPILGRTEIVTYDLATSDDRNGTVDNSYNTKIADINSGSDVNHHIEVPSDSPDFDVDRTRDKTDYGKTNVTTNTGNDGSVSTENRKGSQTGSVKTELSDLGVRPNYESMNGFLDNNRTYIQFFIEKFKECFVPRYRVVL